MNDKKEKSPKYKNKSERNANYKTAAQQIFKDKQILNERPFGMDINEYKILRKIQSETIKRLFYKGHSPSRKLNGILGNKEPLARTKKGMARIIKQRKAS